MKTIKQFLEGRHHFIKRVDKSKKKKYSCQPKTKEELINIIKQRMYEEGPECDLNDIDVSKITSMWGVFGNNQKFDGDISEWDVSHVDNMNAMFHSSSFTGKNGDISNWDVSNVTTMEHMFFDSKYTGEYGDISDWDVGRVKSMESMFDRSKYNGDISEWDIHSVTNMNDMFMLSEFTGENGDISNWDVSGVLQMGKMFASSKFKSDLSNWKPWPHVYQIDMFSRCPVEKNPPKWYTNKLNL